MRVHRFYSNDFYNVLHINSDHHMLLASVTLDTHLPIADEQVRTKWNRHPLGQAVQQYNLDVSRALCELGGGIESYIAVLQTLHAAVHQNFLALNTQPVHCPSVKVLRLTKQI